MGHFQQLAPTAPLVFGLLYKRDYIFIVTIFSFKTTHRDCRDKDCKQRLKVFNNVGAPIAATCFNRDGRIFAYAASYDWSKVRYFISFLFMGTNI